MAKNKQKPRTKKQSSQKTKAKRSRINQQSFDLFFRAKIYFIFLLVITPFWSSEAVLDQSLVPRFWFLTLVLIGGGLLCVKDFAQSKKKIITLFDISFLGYYLVNMTSLFYTVNWGESVFEIQKIGLIFLTYLFTRWLLFKIGDDAERWLLKMVIVLNVLLLGYLVWESFYIYQNEQNAYFYVRLKGVSAHRNLLSSFLYLQLPFLLLGFVSFQKYWKKLALGTLVLTTFAILVIQTRAAMLALVASGGFLLLATQLTTGLLQKIGWKRLALGGGILAAVIVTFFVVTGTAEYGLSRFNFLTYGESNTAKERLFLWGQTWEMVKDNTWLGIGSGNWKLVFPSYGVGEWERTAFKDVIFQRPHNDFLWAWAETGILGFLCYVSMFLFLSIAVLFVMQSKMDAAHKTKLWILLAGLLGYCIIANFSFPRERIEHQIMLTSLFALLLYQTRAWWQRPKWHFSLPIPNVVLGIMAGFILVSCLTIGYYRHQGEIHNKLMYQHNKKHDWKALKQSIHRAYSPLYTLDFASLPLKWFEGSSDIRLKDKDEALKNFKIAMADNPFNDKVLSDIAAIYGERKEYEKVEKYLTMATKINPHRDEVNLNLANLYAIQQKYEKAQTYLNKVRDESDKKRNLESKVKAYLDKNQQ